MWYTQDKIIRILSDMISEILDQPVAAPFRNDSLLTDDLGLNSMQILELSIKINTFFQLHKSDEPPYLLNLRIICDWVEKIIIALKHSTETIAFTTSGTGGARKLVQKKICDLFEEVDFLQQIVPKSNSLISFIPSQNIYGFLFTILLPHKLQIPAIVYTDKIEDHKLSNSLIVATPFHWQYIFEIYHSKNIKLQGISSGAPLDPQLYIKLISLGWTILDVYGSTETGGVGYRFNWKDSFQLFPYFNFNNFNNPTALIYKDNKIISLSDSIIMTRPGYFLVNGRLDGAVQIAGINIQIKDIESFIIAIEEVSSATVYAKGISGNTILFCSITLHNNTPVNQSKCLSFIKKSLTATQLPSKITFN